MRDWISSPRSFLARFAQLLAAWCLLVALGDGVLRHAGLGLEPASQTWPLAVIGAATLAGLAALARQLVPRPSVLVERRGARLVPRFVPVLRVGGRVAVLVGLAVASFGIAGRGIREGEGRTAILSRRDRLVDAPSPPGAPGSRSINYYVTDSPAVRALEGVRSIRVDEGAGDVPALAPWSDGCPDGWIGMGRWARWPVRFPPERLTLDEASAGPGPSARGPAPRARPRPRPG
jgi:hypothetical protein